MTSSFTVVWNSEVEDRLAALWLQSDERAAMTAAVHRIDALLRLDPKHLGDELHEGLNSLEVPPLRVLYEVHDDDRLVRVVGVFPA